MKIVKAEVYDAPTDLFSQPSSAFVGFLPVISEFYKEV